MAHHVFRRMVCHFISRRIVQEAQDHTICGWRHGQQKMIAGLPRVISAEKLTAQAWIIFHAYRQMVFRYISTLIVVVGETFGQQPGQAMMHPGMML
jgi:hypothetical protein